MIANGGAVDLGIDDPGHDVDVYLTATLANLIALWLGDWAVLSAVEDKFIYLDGPRHLLNTAQDWMARSPLVGVQPASSAR
ncbi:MAG: hypothetical protein JXR35_14490 [Rhodobacteraceae bacterium]|nr:hypothetical protein [Paracoccaceae bacterium]